MIRRVLATILATVVLVALPQSADAATATKCRQHEGHKVCQIVTYRKPSRGIWVRRTRIWVTNPETAGNPILTNIVVYLQNGNGKIVKRVETGDIYAGHPSRVVPIRRKVGTPRAIVTVFYTAAGIDQGGWFIQRWVPNKPPSGARVPLPGG